MDVTLYFTPVNFSEYGQENRFSKDTLGYVIHRDTLKASFHKKGGPKIAIFGVPNESGILNRGTTKAPGAIRKQLYRLSNPEGLHGVIDLGDLKPGKNRIDTWFALRDIVDYLCDKGIVSIVLGGGQDISIGISRAFSDDRQFTLSVVDSRIDLKTGRESTNSSNFISRILSENPQMFHLQVIGIQNHLTSVSMSEKLNALTYDCIRLGKIRDDFHAIEPVLRNTTFLSFDISSVRNCDGGGCYQANPNGFHGEEACRIAHYAGLSHKIKVFGLFEVNPAFDNRETTANLSAQMIWYFMDALNHRLNIDPSTHPSAFVKYFVDTEGDPLVFYNHRASGRWWIEIVTGQKDNFIIPCRENDYLTASKKEIPDIWWKFARKTDRLSK